MQEIVSALHDKDVVSGDAASWIYHRVPQLESPIALGIKSTDEYLQKLAGMPSPRLFKTHVRPRYLGPNFIQGEGPRIILLYRNPKDLLASYYHYALKQSFIGKKPGSWNEFFEQSVKPKTLYMGDWADFLLDWTAALKDRPGVLCVSYEDMKRDVKKVILDVARLCGIQTDDDVINRVASYTSFNSLRQQGMLLPDKGCSAFLSDDASHHFRKGVVGDWKNYFTEEQNKYIEEQCTHVTSKCGITFQFEV